MGHNSEHHNQPPHLTLIHPSERHGAHGVSRERLEAARVLWVQSRSTREAATGVGRHLADPENREQAVEAYREAMRLLYEPEHGGLGDVRYQVHDAARVLGLSVEDLRD